MRHFRLRSPCLVLMLGTWGGFGCHGDPAEPSADEPPGRPAEGAGAPDESTGDDPSSNGDEPDPLATDEGASTEPEYPGPVTAEMSGSTSEPTEGRTPPPLPPDATVKAHASGLERVIIEEGPGIRPGPQHEVEVHWVGWLADTEARFHSTYDTGRPLRYAPEKTEMIPAWEEAIPHMRVGGRYRLRVPADLGYGKEGVPGVIPPEADLVFDIELQAVY